MTVQVLLAQLRTLGDTPIPADLPAVRNLIHEEFRRAHGSDDRSSILAIYKTFMDIIEPQISPTDRPAFQKARREDYNLLLITECCVGDNVSPEILEAVTRREVAAGRMSPDNDLRKLAVAGHTILTAPPQRPSIWDRLRAWMRRQ